MSNYRHSEEFCWARSCLGPGWVTAPSTMAGALGSLAQNLSFPGKLYELVGVAAEQGICRLTSTGFVIVNREQLCTKLLPLYFRHDRMDSFQRQLNMCVSRHMREVSQTVGDAIPHTRRPEC